jgi:magnesium transporter
MLVDAVWYRDGRRAASGPVADLATHCGGEGFVWAGLRDPDPAEVGHVVDVFGLHPLAAEDATRSKQRPKAERYGEWLFVVLRTARYLDEPEEIEFGEIQVFVSSAAVIVIRRGEPVPLAPVRARLEAEPGVLAAGPVAVLHAVVDEVVDGYERCLAGLDDDVSEVELEVFSPQRQRAGARLVERMYFLQREILELHRALHPLSGSFPVLRRDAAITHAAEWDAYFRDVADHLDRQQDQLATLRDLLGAALAANANQISLRQNEDMRRISAWVAIVAVPTMIAGIYGMNFEHMPELGWVGGYPATLTVMVAACVSLWMLFRRSGWL